MKRLLICFFLLGLTVASYAQLSPEMAAFTSSLRACKMSRNT